MKIKNKNKGITLVETLLYSALLSLLMTGLLSSIFIFISSESKIDKEKDYGTFILETYHE